MQNMQARINKCKTQQKLQESGQVQWKQNKCESEYWRHQRERNATPEMDERERDQKQTQYAQKRVKNEINKREKATRPKEERNGTISKRISAIT